MADNSTRKGTRQKKPPKHFQYDGQYASYGTPRNIDTKDKPNTIQENSQIAKLFCKFIQNTNQKSRDYLQNELSLRQPKNPTDFSETQLKRDGVNKRTDLRQNIRQTDNAGSIGRRGKDVVERGGQENKPMSKGESTKKGVNGSREISSFNPNIQPDLDYHSLLNQHIRNAYPNMNNISPDMLKGLDIPKHIQELHATSKGKGNKEKQDKLKNGTSQHKPAKQMKNDLKPFKRQSYHVAIAYHIHLKRVRSGQSKTNQIDPTIYARRLREQQISQQNQSRSQQEKNKDQKQKKN